MGFVTVIADAIMFIPYLRIVLFTKIALSVQGHRVYGMDLGDS